MPIKVSYTENVGLIQSKDENGGIFVQNLLIQSGFKALITTRTSNYTIGNEPIIFGNCSSGNLIFTLPDAEERQNEIFECKKIDNTSYLLIISGSLGQTIDGQNNQTISTQYTSIKLIASGSNWYIL